MVTFLHAADLHLGLRLTRFHPKFADRIREARLKALDNVRGAAKERRVDFVVIAGDLFDDHAVDQLTATRAYEMLDDMPMPVYVSPGNHDPLLSGSVWDRKPWHQDGKRLHLLRRAEVVEVDSGVVLLPCPLFRKTSRNDPTAWIAECSANGTAIRVGIAHGSLKVRDDLPADDHLIARHAATELRLDYLALGHWHSQRLFADPDGVERTAYSGVHEPMRFQGADESPTGWVPYGGAGRSEFLDSGKGEVLLVGIKGPRQPPRIEALEVGHFLWKEEQRQLSAKEDLSSLIDDVATRPNVERRLLRLRLSGVLDAASMLRLDELREILTSRYLFGELDEGALHLQPTEADLSDVAGQGVLRRVLEQLQQEASSADASARAVAERAMLLLYQIAKGAPA